MWKCDACDALFDGAVHRFKCNSCDDFDLCDLCYDSPSGWDKFGESIYLHKQNHSFSQRGHRSASNVRSNVFYDLEDTVLAPGTLVCLHSLRTNTELNGAQGTVQRAMVDAHGDITYMVRLLQHGRVVEARSRFVIPYAASHERTNAKQTGAIQQPASEEELKQLLAEHKAVVLAFFTDSCSPCRQMRPYFCKSAQMESFRGTIFVIADPSKRTFKHVASTYGVRSVPTVLHFLHGRLVHSLTIVGYNPSLLDTNVRQLARDASGKANAGDACDLPPTYGRTASEENAMLAAAEAKAKVARKATRAEAEKAAQQREQAVMQKRQQEIDAANKQRLASPMLKKRVRAVGLVKSPELVGRVGRATYFDDLNGRYRVEFEPDGILKALRPENLELVLEAGFEQHEKTTTEPLEVEDTTDDRSKLTDKVAELSLTGDQPQLDHGERMKRDRMKLLKTTAEVVHIISTPFSSDAGRSLARQIAGTMEKNGERTEFCYNPNEDCPQDPSLGVSWLKSWMDICDNTVNTGGKVFVIFRSDRGGTYSCDAKGPGSLDGQAQEGEIKYADSKGCAIHWMDSCNPQDAIESECCRHSDSV